MSKKPQFEIVFYDENGTEVYRLNTGGVSSGFNDIRRFTEEHDKPVKVAGVFWRVEQ